VSEREKVTNIRYKQMDKDPEINDMMNSMEHFILGKKGVGLLEHLGMTPGKIQKFLDDEREKEIEAILEGHRDHIFWEARRRSAVRVQAWITEMKESQSPVTEKDMTEKLDESLKACELEVMSELIEKHL
jgi:hypothetical protein